MKKYIVKRIVEYKYEIEANSEDAAIEIVRHFCRDLILPVRTKILETKIIEDMDIN